jgi:hypothetical protein
MRLEVLLMLGVQGHHGLHARHENVELLLQVRGLPQFFYLCIQNPYGKIQVLGVYGAALISHTHTNQAAWAGLV